MSSAHPIINVEKIKNLIVHLLSFKKYGKHNQVFEAGRTCIYPSIDTKKKKSGIQPAFTFDMNFCTFFFKRLHSIWKCVFLFARNGISFLINHFYSDFELYTFCFWCCCFCYWFFIFISSNKWFTSFQKKNRFVNEFSSPLFFFERRKNVIIYSRVGSGFGLCIWKKAYLMDWKRMKNNNYTYFLLLLRLCVTTVNPIASIQLRTMIPYGSPIMGRDEYSWFIIKTTISTYSSRFVAAVTWNS